MRTNYTSNGHICFKRTGLHAFSRRKLRLKARGFHHPRKGTLIEIISCHLLLYDVVDDYVERRAAFRDEHLKLARSPRTSPKRTLTCVKGS